MILFNDQVARIRQTPDGEERVEFDAHILSDRQFTLRPNSDVDSDDLIEWVNPAGRKNVYRVTEVNFRSSPRGLGNRSHLDHTEVRVTRADAPRPVQPVRAVTIEGLHPEVSAAAGVLFADGQYPEAVFAAFKAVEARVMSLSPMTLSGSKLMGAVFSGTPAKLDTTTTTGQNAQDEREGFKLLFMGAVQGIRNPRGHGERPEDTPEEAIEPPGAREHADAPPGPRREAPGRPGRVSLSGPDQTAPPARTSTGPASSSALTTYVRRV